MIISYLVEGPGDEGIARGNRIRMFGQASSRVFFLPPVSRPCPSPFATSSLFTPYELKSQNTISISVLHT